MTYDNFTPKITDILTTDPTVAPGRNGSQNGSRQNGQPKEPSDKKTNGSQAGKRKNEKVSTVSSRNKWLTAEYYRKLASNQVFRSILGLVYAGLAVYLTITLISFVKTGITDHSEIAHSAIGTAKSVTNPGGEAGARLAELLINDTFGVGSLMIIFWLAMMCCKMFNMPLRFKTVNFTIKCIIALIGASLVVGLMTIGLETPFNWGGAHGRYVNQLIIDFTGWLGALILSIVIIGVLFVLCMSDVNRWFGKLREVRAERKRLARSLREAEEAKEALKREIELKEQAEAIAAEGQKPEVEVDDKDDKSVSFDPHEAAINDVAEEVATYNLEDDAPAEVDEAASEENPVARQAEGIDSPMVVNTATITEGSSKNPAQELHENFRFPYKFPPYEMLKEQPRNMEIDADEQLENKDCIRRTLLDFGIPITSIEATVGPTVTLYEIVPEKGVKIAKIRSLAEDIALRIKAEGVRIIAPIPGKGTVGIEVPNRMGQIVSMRNIIKSKAFQVSRCKLPIALGSTISNQVFIADLAKMPHLLVAGATGQGKSVGLNAIIASLLYCRRPDELKFVMIDPKMVEFAPYQKIESHYLAKLPDDSDAIVTDVNLAPPILSSLCEEMENRYKLLRKAGVRNLDEYNKMYSEHVLHPKEGHRHLPYIVVIVDEFSDLIMQKGKEVETPIARLAQKARAVGIHVILATQRPSTDVLTGLIKGNFTARIAFKVSSPVDSKVILGVTGAQHLIGRGDMLVSNNSELVRVQCALIETEEVNAICDYISKQPYGQGAYPLPEPKTSEDSGESRGEADFIDRDPLFEEVGRAVVTSNTASTSSLQRRYGIGYNRAAKIMDQLEKVGVVGPSHGGKPRTVLVDIAGYEEIINSL